MVFVFIKQETVILVELGGGMREHGVLVEIWQIIRISVSSRIRQDLGDIVADRADHVLESHFYRSCINGA